MYRTNLARPSAPTLVVFSVLVLLACGCEIRSTATFPSATSPDDTASEPLNETVEPESSQPEKSTAIRNIKWEDVEFDLEPGEPFERHLLTEEIEELVGQTVVLRGFMLPTLQRKGIQNFIFIRDDQKCCFGPGAAIYHCVQIEMVDGASAEYTTKPVAITGKFDIRPFIGPDDKHWAIYYMAATKVE